MITIQDADPIAPEVRAVLDRHFALMRSQSPEESCHVLTADALDQEPGVLMCAVQDGQVVGIGAFVTLSPDHAELKSMHTLDVARGRGVGRAILHALMDRARCEGIARLSLETGSADAFAAARALYAAEGFRECPPFGTYKVDPLSVFMTREI